jgi:hypothetical protein
MKNRISLFTFPLLIGTFLQFSTPVLANGSAGFRYCSFFSENSVRPDSEDITASSGLIRIRQVLPEGDTMTATFTSKNNESIVNEDGTIPKIECTVSRERVGIMMTLFPVLNGKPVTDIHQKHTNPAILSGIIQLAAFEENTSGNLNSVELSTWLSDNSFLGDNFLRVPDFINSASDIYYGVNLETWGKEGFKIDDSFLGTTFNITNGISNELPGFIFSTTPLSYTEDGIGWETLTPFDGEVIGDSFHELAVVVPEHTSFVPLFTLGTLGATSIFKRKLKSSKSRELS